MFQSSIKHKKNLNRNCQSSDGTLSLYSRGLAQSISIDRVIVLAIGPRKLS